MNTRIGHASFPVQKKKVLCRQTREAPALEGIVLGELYACLDLALVVRHGWTGRQHHRAIVAAELCHLRVEFGIMPVRPCHSGSQVVNDQRARNPTEVTERIFQTPNISAGVSAGASNSSVTAVRENKS